MPDPPEVSPYPLDRSALEVVDMHAPDDTLAYWASKTIEERIAGIEYMRMMAHGTDPVNDRIERTLEVADFPIPRGRDLERAGPANT